MKIDNQELIKDASSKALAGRVVVYRALGIDKDIAILCMQELAKRRKEGEVFPYEDFIDEEVKKIPQPQKLNLASIISGIKRQTG